MLSASFDATACRSIAPVAAAAGLDRLETCARFVALLEFGALAPSLVGGARASHATLVSAARRTAPALFLHYECAGRVAHLQRFASASPFIGSARRPAAGAPFGL